VERTQPWEIITEVDNPDHPKIFHRLSRLTPNSTYQLIVRAKNEIGWSEPSDQFTFVTREGKYFSFICDLRLTIHEIVNDCIIIIMMAISLSLKP